MKWHVQHEEHTVLMVLKAEFCIATLPFYNQNSLNSALMRAL